MLVRLQLARLQEFVLPRCLKSVQPLPLIVIIASCSEETVQTMHDDAAEQPRRRWLMHLAAVQACLAERVAGMEAGV